jgi:hypothetical protein
VLAQAPAKRLVLAQQVLDRDRRAGEPDLDPGHPQALEDVEHPRADPRAVPRVGQEPVALGLKREATDDRQEEVGHVGGRRQLVELAVVDRHARNRVLVGEHSPQAAELRRLADARAAEQPDHDRAVAPRELLCDLEDRVVADVAVPRGPEDVDVPVLRLELAGREVLDAKRRDLGWNAGTRGAADRPPSQSNPQPAHGDRITEALPPMRFAVAMSTDARR